MYMWVPFDENNWPGDYPIFCSTCGNKNRSDSGWWYNKSNEKCLEDKQKNETHLRILFPKIKLQENEYTCPYCITIHNLKYTQIEKLPISTLKKHLKYINYQTNGDKKELVNRLLDFVTNS
jgi:hypothetical protein